MARTNKYTERRMKGIVTPYGQWLYPGKVTTIPGNNITMQGVPYPVLGISDKGDTKMMMPGMDYQFKGNNVTEYPVIEKAQLGNWLKETARKLFDSEARNAPSYKKDETSFSNAFNDARSKGYNTFYWDGRYYNTVKKEELDENNQLKKDVYFPSYDIKEYIKNTESFRPNVYVDGKGIETIGYGFTDKDIIEKYRNTGMTREVADTIFNDYINSFVGELRNTPHFEDLNQNQRDSLLSYMYNIGATNYFNNSPLMQEALQNKNWAEAAKQMDYGYNDSEDPGLRKRRDYERKLFLTPVKQEGGDLLAYNEPSYFLAGQQMNKNKPYTASTSGIYASKWPTRDAAISNGVENGSSQQAFFEDLFNAMTGYMKNNGIDENVGRPVAYDIVAHHAMESSSGGRLPAPFNYGGVRIPGSEDYKSFNDMNDYAKYYFENTVGGRNVLEQAIKGNAMSLEDYMRMLKDNGYFEADLDTYTANTRKDGYARAQKYLDDISYQTGGVKKFETGMVPPHWDPEHPHVHIDKDGNILPADYAGPDNAYQFDIVEGVTPKKIIDAITAHSAAMEDDRYRFVDNPEYLKLLPSIHTAKKNYDWGNTKMQTYPYVTNWNWYMPKMPLSFDDNGIGYKDGKTYLPINGGSGESYTIPTFNKSSNASYTEYYPINIPAEKIKRNSFPAIPFIDAIAQEQAKKDATNKYIKDNTSIQYRLDDDMFSIGENHYNDGYFNDVRDDIWRTAIAGGYEYPKDTIINNEDMAKLASDNYRNELIGYKKNEINELNDAISSLRSVGENDRASKLQNYADIASDELKKLQQKKFYSKIVSSPSYEDAEKKSEINLIDLINGMKEQTGGKIHIKEKNRGKFTEAAQRAGKSVQAYAAQILANKDNYSPTIIKRANFARNAAKWKHQTGGIDKYLEGNYIQPKTVDSVMGAWNDMLAKRLSKGDMIANHVGNALNAAATASAAAATQFGKNFTKDIMAGQLNEQTSVAAPKSEVKFDLDEDLLKTSQEMEAANYIEEPVSPSVIMYEKQYDRNQQLLNQQVPMTAPRPYVDTNKQWFFDPRQINVEFGSYHNNPINPFNMLPGPHSPNKIDTTGYNNWQKQMMYSKPYFQKGGSISTPAEIERGEVVSTSTGDSVANGLMDYHELFSNRNEKGKNIVNLTNDMGKDVQRNPQLTSINERVNKYTAMRRNGKTFIFPSTVGRNGEILEPKNGNLYWLAKTINKK